MLCVYGPTCTLYLFYVGNVKDDWPKLFQALSVKFTIIFFMSVFIQSFHIQAAKCKWRALRHTCLLLLSILGGMPASHQGMQAGLFVVDIYIK